jgi:hypothetical protein
MRSPTPTDRLVVEATEHGVIDDYRELQTRVAKTRGVRRLACHRRCRPKELTAARSLMEVRRQCSKRTR